jgi:hypothetical protein
MKQNQDNKRMQREEKVIREEVGKVKAWEFVMIKKIESKQM